MVKSKRSPDKQVHGVFVYMCKSCGQRRCMWLEKGVEEHCNPRLRVRSGLPHKPTPFVIRCPVCRKIDMVHVCSFYCDEFHPANLGDDIFVYDKDRECAMAVFNWTGKLCPTPLDQIKGGE